MRQEQSVAAVIIVLISEKNKSRKKRKERKVCAKTWLERRKNLAFYETLLAELPLEDEYNYKNYLLMTSENFKEIFQLIKNHIGKENTQMSELIPPRL